MKLTQQQKILLKRNYLNFFGHENYQQFAVVGHARTGSNFLCAGLENSNDVKMHHEIFSKQNEKSLDQVLSGIFQKERIGVKAVGFKVFYYHLMKDEWKNLLSRKKIKIIHLIRKNRLRSIVSLAIAFKTGQWSSTIEQPIAPAVKSVSIDTSKLIKNLERIRDYELFIKNHCKNSDLIEITYETLFGNSLKTFQHIGDFLGIDAVDPDKVTLKKQNPEKLAQLILNYHEVYQLLKNTPFFKYINE